MVVLAKLPLTANGKLDRKALPEPEWSGGEVVEPRTELERELLELWRATLGVSVLGVKDNFFDLGGDSIVSLQVVSRANAKGLKIKPSDVFRHPTIEALAKVCVETAPGRAPRRAHAGLGAPQVELSAEQVGSARR